MTSHFTTPFPNVLPLHELASGLCEKLPVGRSDHSLFVHSCRPVKKKKKTLR